MSFVFIVIVIVIRIHVIASLYWRVCFLERRRDVTCVVSTFTLIPAREIRP